MTGLVERLRNHANWYISCACGNVPDEAATELEAADAITRLQAENAEMKEAIDSAEIASGVTSDGSLWRFWSQKAIDLATRVSELKRENASLREQVEKAREDALEEAAKVAEESCTSREMDDLDIGWDAACMIVAERIRRAAGRTE